MSEKLRSILKIKNVFVVYIQWFNLLCFCRLLQNNQLTGPIPSELGQLSELETLDLSGNRFSGEIPASLGFLTHLNYL